MEEVGMDMALSEGEYKPKKINNITNDVIVDMIYEYIIDEFKRIENFIKEENNALSKEKDVLIVDGDDDAPKLKSLSQNEIEIHNFGRYSFNINEDCVKVSTYAFNKRLTHHFLYEDENGKETELGKIYKKVLNDVLFYKLPKDVKKAYIRKHKINNLI